MKTDWKISILTIQAMPYLSRLGRKPKTEDYDDALGAAYRDLEAELPFEDASELYCDLDARWKIYRRELKKRYGARSGNGRLFRDLYQLKSNFHAIERAVGFGHLVEDGGARNEIKK
jgi:hypothetical protein